MNRGALKRLLINRTYLQRPLINFPGRLFWFALLIFFSSGCQPRVDSSTPPSTTPGPRVTVLGQREYDVHQQLTLINDGPGQPEKQNIWVALIRDFPPYQEVRSMEISPTDYTLVIDEYDNHYENRRSPTPNPSLHPNLPSTGCRIQEAGRWIQGAICPSPGQPVNP